MTCLIYIPGSYPFFEVVLLFMNWLQFQNWKHFFKRRIYWIKNSLSHFYFALIFFHPRIFVHLDDLYRSATVGVHYRCRLQLIDIQTWQSEMLTSLARDYISYQGNGAATGIAPLLSNHVPGTLCILSAEVPSAFHIFNKLFFQDIYSIKNFYL